MVAETVHVVIRVGRHAGGGRHHGAAHAGVGRHGKPVEETLVDVGVECGIGFDQIAGFFTHRDRRGLHDRAQRDRQRDRNDGAKFHILRIRCKAFGRNRKVVGIEGNVGEAELTGGVRLCGAVETADGIVDFHRRAKHHRAGLILHRAEQ